MFGSLICSSKCFFFKENLINNKNNWIRDYVRALCEGEIIMKGGHCSDFFSFSVIINKECFPAAGATREV